MKVAFFGLGSIGTRHAKLLKENFDHELYAFRSGKSDRTNGLSLRELHSWRDVDEVKPEVAFITNPTFMHLDTAIECARRKMSLFIEKPLDSRSTNLKRLLSLVSHQGTATYVAYVLRFHPVIQELKKYVDRFTFLHTRVVCTSYLPLWRPRQDHRKSYSAFSEMGGGVLLDLSHELDYTEFLLGKIRSIKARHGRRSDLTVDAEDYGDMLLETDCGPANIHVNFLSHIAQRIVQIDFKEKSVVGDLIQGTVTEYAGERGVRKRNFKSAMDCSYRRQLSYFFANIRNPKMMNNIFEAAELFKKIHALKSHRLCYG